MFDRLSSLWKRKREPKARLSQEQAFAIALAASENQSVISLNLAIATYTQSEGRNVWVVSSGTLGKQLVVVIDDATGEILENSVVGVR
ncbi:MAG TPA: PepSY domain-containing protein [Polyangiales bacterium]